MKLIPLSLIVLIALFSSMTFADTPNKLVFLTWEDYIDEDVIAEFEKRYNAEIEFVYFEHDEERDDMVASPEGRVYDVIMLDGQTMVTYRRLGWLEPLAHEHIPNLKYYNTDWQKMRPDAVGYSIPYAWGTAGIAYRKDLVSQPVNSLAALFQPSPEVRNKIIMTPQILELVPAALSYLRLNPNSFESNDLKRAEQVLLQQRPYVQSYHALRLDEESALVKGTASIAYAYNSDALTLMDLNENITYVVPKEGSPRWIDFLVVSSRSAKKNLAYQFLNFMSDTDIVARNVETIYAASFNDYANAKLPKEIRENPIIFHNGNEELYLVAEPDSTAARKMSSILQLLNITTE